MKIYSKEIFIEGEKILLDGLENIRKHFNSGIVPKTAFYKPIRFAVAKSTRRGCHCEVDFLVAENKKEYEKIKHINIFNFQKRRSENVGDFNSVLLIPTGIGAEIGGHCGDGNAVARLIASACDTLITHPNVVNASDINEMTENTMYVEGSIITRLLMGQIGLQKVRSNKVLMLMDKHPDKYFNDEIVNAVSSARVTLGLNCDVMEMKNIIESDSVYSNIGRAIGNVKCFEKLVIEVEKFKDDYNAIGMSTFIEIPAHYHKQYFCKDGDMVNPWGGIEAMITHSLAEIFGIPCAHSPMATMRDLHNLNLGIVDPRKAPETASVTYLHCVLKGLQKSPQITSYEDGLSIRDISCLIIPDKCIGLPTLACLEQGIPVIAVKENKNIMKNNLNNLPFEKEKLFIVDNYLEAVGVMHALKAGIATESVRRPMKHTTHTKI